MPTIDKDSIAFQFMLKEYEKLYSKFEMHYQAVEKSINFYIIVIGAIISLQGLVYKTEQISIFSLTGIQLLFLLITVIFGNIIYFKVVEHRILIIAYVKSLNLNRKWFLDNSEDPELSKYFFFKADVKSPLYYKPFRHFYWEALGLSAMNALLLSLFIVNSFIRMFAIESTHALKNNCITIIILAIILAYFSVRMYQWRGISETQKVDLRIKNNEIKG